MNEFLDNNHELEFSSEEDEKHIVLSKLDCARSQLETAIKLFFEDGDPVSIHTLASAAYELLKGINKARDLEPLLLEFEFLRSPENSDLKKRALKQIRSFQNFFKHADNDPEERKAMRPRINEHLIQHCVEVFRKFASPSELIVIFDFWYTALHFNILPPETQAKFPPQALEIFQLINAKYTRATKGGYFIKMLKDMEP
jgi:hypothetical protein